MPKTILKESFELATRTDYTKVECEVSIQLDGKELPSLNVVGTAVEEMIDTLKRVIKESYKVVPERVT